MNSKYSLILACLFVISSPNLEAKETEFSGEQIEFFEKKIRPILVEHCLECHGAEEHEASLRLDSRSAILKGGDTGPAIVLGKSDQGELLAALSYDPDGYQMPPDGKLPNEKIELFKKWIEMGVPWPEGDSASVATGNEFDLEERAQHWSFQPLEKNVAPEVEHANWSRNGIDQFVLKKLEEHQLSPNDEADRRTWIRRAYLDVIGLPPTTTEVQDFLADHSETAHETVVDRLLASPHFGERWGRHWLDVVRYAESRGHEFDYDVANAWHYRDYVIRAVNADVPFDQFVVEHVAGDLLTPQTEFPRRSNPQTGVNESIVGTGFWYLGEWVHSPVDIRQEEADRFDNMIDVYSKAFLGLTVACARCHDHKFDPIRQKDYYALQGFLQSSSYQQARYQTMLKNEALAEEINQLDREISKVLKQQLINEATPVLENLDQYLLAARDVIRDSTPGIRDDVVYESFESGTYANWTTTGDAFGKTPQTQATIGTYQGDVGATGKFFVNSHQIRDGGLGDKHTGTLTSAEFEITAPFIHMLIGGGNHVDKTCVNLAVADEVVFSATGKNSNRMSPVAWDVQKYVGEKARIQIVDNVQGGWGNIGLDHIVFSHRAELDGPVQQTITAATVEKVARKYKLKPALVENWAKYLLGVEAEDVSKSEKQEPVAFETQFSAGDLIPSGPGFRYVSSEVAPLLIASFNGNVDFINGYSSEGYFERSTVWKQLKEAPGNQKEPGAIGGWNRAGQILRTPTFEIQSGKLHLLVRGQVNTYVAVDSHILLNGPLHKAIVKSHPNHGGWHWIEHDVSAYAGHDAHVELIPVGESDFAVQTVIQSGENVEFKLRQEERSSLSKLISKRFAELASATPVQAAVLPTEVIAAALEESKSHAELFAFISSHQSLFKSFADPIADSNRTELDSLVSRRKELVSQIEFTSATTPCMLDGSPKDEYVFIRGAWKKKGATVPRRYLEVFGGTPIESAGSGRLELALQMVDPEQTPILPRVIVNRLWHHYFGRGICPTPNDFGHLGQRPSHPELLDWLANQLVLKDWSLKAIHRMILLSSTYRMSSKLRSGPKVVDIDPDNRLLHRMNVKRLEGEVIRDGILKVSGQLNSEMYGPSVPIHLTSFLEGRGRPSQSGPIDGQGRRSIYIAVRRNFPEPFFQAFDFPNPHSSIGRRNVSNVPAQALALMNNPMVLEQTQKWAEKMLTTLADASVEERIRFLFETAYSREPNAAELELGKQFLVGQIEEFQANENDPQLWADYCHILLNSKEFYFVR